MPEIVKADVRQALFLQQPLELLVERGWCHHLPDRVTEHQPAVLPAWTQGKPLFRLANSMPSQRV
jgi:hypothetical protein